MLIHQYSYTGQNKKGVNMDFEGIPKSFWNAASFALISFTIGFLFISYKYGDLTVKFNELEVRTTNTIALEDSLQKQEESIRAQQKIIAEREKEVSELKALLDARAKELEEVKQELAALHQDQVLPRTAEVVTKLKRVSDDDSLKKAFDSSRLTLETLEKEQALQQKVYENQRSLYETQQQIQQQWLPTPEKKK